MNGRKWAMAAAMVCAATFGAADPAFADKIKHATAVFAGLDKITARIITFEVAMNETVQFGSLQITPRVCYSRPPTEAPRTDAFAEVDEVDENKHTHRIFTGWMFADSPGMHGIEHPVYDIWLKACKGPTEVIHEAPDIADAPLPDADASDLGAAPAPAPAQAAPKATAAPAPRKRRVRAPPVSGAASPLNLDPPSNSAQGRAATRRDDATGFDQNLVPPDNVGR